jgi:hypothetical protein
MAVPLIARAVTLGVAAFTRAEHPEPYGEADMRLASDLVSRAAIHIDNARLYTREHHTAITLQRSLLPASLSYLRLGALYGPGRGQEPVFDPLKAALAEADTCSGRIDITDAAIDLFSPSQFGRMAGSCYLFLQENGRAQSLLEDTAQALHDQSKPYAIVLGNLALAALRLGNVDEAAARLHQAMDVIEVNWGGGGLNIVFGASRELRPWRDVPAVQDVQDRLLSLMTTR